MRLFAGTLSSVATVGLALCGPSFATARPGKPHPGRAAPASPAPFRAPAGPALVAPRPAEAPAREEAAGVARPQPDPLVTNGLGSPACGAPLGAELTSPLRRNCETAGFTAAGAPTDNFGLDVHIDTGLIPLSGGNLLSAIQDMLVTPVWLAAVWLVRVLVVMLEWCFGLDLLTGASSGTLQATLSRAAAGITAPWLPLAMSAAAVLAAYHGLVRRRVAQTLGETAAMLAMIAGGAWLIVDPAGTVGALSTWSGEAGLGTLAVAARGTPSAPSRALAEGMDAVYAAAIEAPWCYLEFGNVGWCREPSRLDPGLRRAALRMAGRESSEAHCATSSCDGGSSSLASSARLLREAATNGDEFLALPPNGPGRNSINDTGSLLRAICRASDATACTGPSAAEAEFRTNSGTWPRVGGLLLIAIGLAGMLLLLGYVGLRLLLAAILCVFYLLLTPGIVLLPALGEGGRAVFRAWALRLAGAVAAKLVFAFLLGVLLTVMTVLDTGHGFGWWVHWLLLSAFWWGAFLKRHEILARAPGARVSSRANERFDRVRKRREERVRRDRDARGRSNRGSDASDRATAVPRVPPRPPSAGVAAAPRGTADARPDEQSRRMLRFAGGLDRAGKRDALMRLSEARAQLGRIERARGAAVAAGDKRRAARLAIRAARVSQSARHAAALAGGAAAAGVRRAADPRGDGVARASELLDRQARLPSVLERGRGEPGRDYPAIARLVGLTRERYERLDPPSRRRARLAIDRELSARRRHRGLTRHEPGASAATPGVRTDEPAGAPEGNASREPLRPERRREESPVMEDARAVAEGRKRELGFGRP